MNSDAYDRVLLLLNAIERRDSNLLYGEVLPTIGPEEMKLLATWASEALSGRYIYFSPESSKLGDTDLPYAILTYVTQLNVKPSLAIKAALFSTL